MPIDTEFSTYLTGFMMNVVLLAGVPLALATLSGFTIAFFQAITQIQDQTLAQTVKIAVITIVLLSFGAVLANPLMTSTQQVFDSFHLIVK